MVTKPVLMGNKTHIQVVCRVGEQHQSTWWTERLLKDTRDLGYLIRMDLDLEGTKTLIAKEDVVVKEAIEGTIVVPTIGAGALVEIVTIEEDTIMVETGAVAIVGGDTTAIAREGTLIGEIMVTIAIEAGETAEIEAGTAVGDMIATGEVLGPQIDEGALTIVR